MGLPTVARIVGGGIAALWAAIGIAAAVVGLPWQVPAAAAVAAVGAAGLPWRATDEHPVAARIGDCSAGRWAVNAVVAGGLAGRYNSTAGPAAAAATIVAGAAAEFQTGTWAGYGLTVIGTALWGATAATTLGGSTAEAYLYGAFAAQIAVAVARARDVKKRPESGEMWLPARLTKLLYWEVVGTMAATAHLAPAAAIEMWSYRIWPAAATAAAAAIAALWALDKHKSAAPAIAAQQLTGSLLTFAGTPDTAGP